MLKFPDYPKTDVTIKYKDFQNPPQPPVPFSDQAYFKGCAPIHPFEEKDGRSYSQKEIAVHNTVSPLLRRIPQQQRDTRFPQSSFLNVPQCQKKSQSSSNSDHLEEWRELRNVRSYIQGLQGSGDYDDLEAMRGYRRSIVHLQKKYGENSLKSGRKFKDFLEPHKDKVNAKIQTCLKSAEVAGIVALEKCIAKKKAQKVRDYRVTTNQIKSILSPSLLEIDTDKDLQDVSKALARQINEILENKTKYRGKNIQFRANEKVYPFYSFQTEDTEYLDINFHFWLELSQDAKQLHLLLIPAINSLIHEGAYKKVYKAQSYFIPLQAKPVKIDAEEEQGDPSSTDHSDHPRKREYTTYERKAKYIPMVLQVAKRLDCVRYIERGMELQKRILDLIPGIQIQLPNLAKKPAESAPGTMSFSDTPVYYLEWYNGDLASLAISDSTIPLDMNEDSLQRLKVSFIESFDTLIDVGTTLIRLHKEGIVHHDIKPDNIFLQVTEVEGKSVKGIPADFDLAQIIGIGKAVAKEQPARYWDTLSNQGIVTPFTDVYGLALSLSAVFLPAAVLADPKCLLDDETQSTILWMTIQENLKNHLKDTRLAMQANAKKPSAAFINNILIDLKTLTNTSPTDLQIQSKKCYAEILAVKKIIALVADVVRKDQDLSSLFSVEYDHQWPLISISNPSLPSKKTQKKLVESTEKTAALNFLRDMKDLSRNEQWEHPLYLALKNPMELNTQEAIDACIHTEIELLDIPLVLHPYAREALNGLSDCKNRSEELKRMVDQINQDTSQTGEIKNAAGKILKKIFTIEKAAAFAVQLREEYNEIFPKIAVSSMTMETFVSKLMEIKQTYYSMI